MPQSNRPKTSAGLLMFRRRQGAVEVLLVHPGGPFFTKKDDGHWSVPKGLIESADEDLLSRARIEFEEETGVPINAGSNYLPLGEITQKGGKVVHAFAVKGDLPADFICRSNTFELEWPPRSGKRQAFPEVDRAEFFSLARAREKINPAQIPLLDRLAGAIGTSP